MQLTIARTPSLRPILAVVMLALLIVALVATALYIGSNRRTLPAPFGPARNGAVVYDQDGDLFIAERAFGRDSVARRRSRDGRLAELLEPGRPDRLRPVGEGDFQLMSMLPDGSGMEVLGEFPGEFNGYGWSPDGTRSSSTSRKRISTGSGLPSPSPMVRGDASSISEGLRLWFLAARRPAHRIPWPARRRNAGAFIANGDGTNVRQLPIDSVDLSTSRA